MASTKIAPVTYPALTVCTLCVGIEIERPLRDAVHTRRRGERLSARHQAQGEENARFHKYCSSASLNWPSQSIRDGSADRHTGLPVERTERSGFGKMIFRASGPQCIRGCHNPLRGTPSWGAAPT
jgi:hypothetical protein